MTSKYSQQQQNLKHPSDNLQLVFNIPTTSSSLYCDNPCDDIQNNQLFADNTRSIFESSLPSDRCATTSLIDDKLSDHLEGDELPICQSYSDMEESLRAQHRHSRLKHWLLHWFYRRFIELRPGEDSFITQMPPLTSTDLPVSVISTQNEEDKHKTNKKMLWSLNYLEASIYLEEGLNNDKFDHHPHLFTKLPMYLIAHNRLVYALDLFCCWLILSLALAEKPAADRYHLPEAVHATVELICLSIIALILLFKFLWIGASKFLNHGRTLIKTVVLCLMIIEAIVVLWRQDSHFRVTRSLRPVFLIDNFHFFGVRRVIRQTFQSLKSFLDMLALLLFFLIFFSISAFYLFSTIPNYTQFSTIVQSFLSLFVLLTTANFPDVMMPAYQKSQLYALFFIVFLVINLYFLLNIMLAVVYNSFSQIEKEKFRKLFLHRRKACDHAFRLLVTTEIVEYIQFKHFNGLLQHLKPRSSQLERFLMYKALVMEVFTPSEDRLSKPLSQSTGQQQSISAQEYLQQMIETKDSKKQRKRFNKDDVLTLEKFYHIYEVLNLRWENLDKSAPWFDRVKYCSNWFRIFVYKLRAIILHRYFEFLSYLIIILAAIYQFLDALIGWNANHVHKMFNLSTSTRTICAIFIALYTVEMCLKILAMGPTDYFCRRWNQFDFVITVVALVTFIMNEYVHTTTLTISTSFFSFRSLKLLNVLRHHVKRYRDILGPFALIIIKRFMSVIMVVLIVYYSFAIIAMECFGKYSLKDCCINTTLEPYYRSNGSTTSFYYLNNFQDLITSYITLFELMVVNNWHILMQAYVIVTNNQWSYLFFIAFYIITLVVITIVVSFVLDTFNFHIEYKQRFGPNDSMSVKISIEIPLTQNEFVHYQILDNLQQSSQNCCRRPSPRFFPCPIQIFCGWYDFSIFCSTGSSFFRFDRINESFKDNSPTINTINEDFETIVSCGGDSEMVETANIDSSTTVTAERTIMFRGQKIRDKFSYNLRMYHDELNKWIEQSKFS